MLRTTTAKAGMAPSLDFERASNALLTTYRESQLSNWTAPSGLLFKVCNGVGGGHSQPTLGHVRFCRDRAQMPMFRSRPSRAKDGWVEGQKGGAETLSKADAADDS